MSEIADVSVNAAWAAVMDEVRSVGKGDYNEDQGFRFRGIDSMLNAVGPALRTHGVIVVPKRVLDHTTESYETRRGTRMVNRCVTIEWEVRGPAGDSFTGEAIGEAADAGDKSATKAQTVSYRTFLIEALCLPTGDRDPDADSHERAAIAAPTELDEAIATLGDTCRMLKLDAKAVADRFYHEQGKTVREASVADVRSFVDVLLDEAQQDQSAGEDADDADS